MSDITLKNKKWISPCITGHNRRSRYTTGFHCDDCGVWVARGTVEHLRQEDLWSISAAVGNFCCSYTQKGLEPPSDAKKASDELFNFYINKNHEYYDDKELIEILKSYLPIFEKYKLNAQDTICILK